MKTIQINTEQANRIIALLTALKNRVDDLGMTEIIVKDIESLQNKINAN